MNSLSIGVGLAVAESALEAGRVAARLALDNGGFNRADAAVCALIPAAGDCPEVLLKELTLILGTEKILTLSVEQLMDGTREVREEGSVCVFALKGVGASLLSYADLVGEEAGLGPALLAGLDCRRKAENQGGETLVLLGFDCLQLSPERLQEGLSLPGQSSCVIGIGVAPRGGEKCALWAGLEPIPAGAAALILELDEKPQTVMIPSWRREESWRRVTRAQGNWVLEVDGENALSCYRKAAGSALGEDLLRAREFVFVATSQEEGNPTSREVERVVDVVGLSEERGGFALPQALRSGSFISFAFRDGNQARMELQHALQSMGSPAPRALLYLGDRSRGEDLFGVSGLESGYLSRAFPGVPVAGIMGVRLLVPGPKGVQLCNHTALAIGLPSE